MSYTIGKLKFKLKELSLREDEKLSKFISSIKVNVPVQMQFVNESVVITGGFISEIIASKKARKIYDMILGIETPEDAPYIALLFRFKTFRLYYFGKHIKGDLKGKIFTDFFTEGTVYAASLVNHLLMLLTSRIAQMEELKHKEAV